MALSLRAEARGSSCNLAETQRLRLAPEWAQQTNPHTREAYKKPGKHPTALSLRAEARGLFLQVCRDPAT